MEFSLSAGGVISEQTNGYKEAGRPYHGFPGLPPLTIMTERVLIVGAGCFGVSTAYHLLTRGYTDVIVIDKADVLPAPDAASTDLNKGCSSFPERTGL